MSSEKEYGRLTHKVVDLIVGRPILCSSIIITFALLLSGIGFAAYPFAIDTTGVTFVPRSSIEFELQEAFQLGEERTRFNPLRSPSNQDVNVPNQTQDEYQLTVLFAVPEGENIFTSAKVIAMRDMLQAVTSRAPAGGTAFTDVCLRSRSTGDCQNPNSLLPYFFAEPVTGCPNVFDATGNSNTLAITPEDTLRALVQDGATNAFCSQASPANCSLGCRQPSLADISWAVSDDFGQTTGSTIELTSDVTRAVFRFGLPLPGFADPNDRYDDQIAIIEGFVRDAQSTLNSQPNPEGLDVRTISPVLTADYFWDLVIQDATLVVVSIFMVQIYIIFHTQSFFLGLLGMLHVLLSFPLAYLFNQMAMDFGGMGVLNLMALFIILGIGADDIFIVVDTWKQSHIEISRKGETSSLDSSAAQRDPANRDWIKRRMLWTYTRSTSAMLITSLTTGAAFVMNLSSTVPAIQIFGGFTAFMVFFNYILVITWYPCIIALYQYHAQFWWSPISLCIKSNDIDRAPTPDHSKDYKTSANDHENRDVSQYRSIERAFYNSYAPFVFKFRWALVIGFAIWFVICLGFATQLSAAEEPARWLPEDDPLQQTFDLLTDRFARQTVPPQMAVVYGLRNNDNDGVNPYDPNSVGKTRFDPNFDVSTPSAQQAFVDICARLRDEDFVFNREVLCPMDLFANYVTSLGRTFPVPAADFIPLLANFTRDYEQNEGPAPDVSGLTGSSKQDAETREARRQQELELYQTIRFDMTASPPVLRYMAMIVNTTLPVQATGQQIEVVYDQADVFMQRENQRAENQDASLDNGFHTASDYLNMVLEQTLLTAAVVGIAASISLSFVIILALTTDLLLSVMSIVAIGGVVTTLIAIVVWLGWSLSIIESICLTILVGLSVDYVIHMGNAYRDSSSHTRYGRVGDAMLTMAISVLSASITTMLSACVLLFTVVVFFFKFGAFIMLTILVSACWAFIFFMAWLAIMGNVEHHNDFVWLWNKLRGRQQSQRQSLAISKQDLVVSADEDLDRESQLTVTQMV